MDSFWESFQGRFNRAWMEDGRVSLPSWTLPVKELLNSSKMLAVLIMGNHRFSRFFFFFRLNIYFLELYKLEIHEL